ncbi:hypothetical protein KUV78_03705 [Marinobacter hydrocarbonoclasticus]|uniref:hypothetical protein n=1 Tax=Marinobacter nauticus TaxID=2743 RepID=UPI001C93A23B|nr:hypothetical protein [Marinobacter nauticus]MBY6192895.1 hypothetical protein [Marinobacter nauticus]MBY6214043.1 hypothetical protein [Marinobacter nauticus]
MEIVSSAYHVLSVSFIFIIGGIISTAAGRAFEITAGKSLLLYLWHSGFSLLYCWYVLSFGGDALGYFLGGQDWAGQVGVGSKAVTAISAFFVSGLGFSILGVFFVFNVFGLIGLLAFCASLREATLGKPWRVRWLATLIIFLPSVSFWSSALGKDAIAFMATGLALWSSLNLSRRGSLMVFAVGSMFIVRPHMAGIMVIAIGVALLVDSNASVLRKALLGVCAAGVAAALVPFALRYAGVGEVVDVESLASYIDKRQSYNTEGGGGVDIASMSLPMQLFTYLFRPVLFEARSVFALAASLDNLILLGLFVFGSIALLRGRKTGLGENRTFMWAYALGAWLILAMTTANLGIALRQKWMFAPMLIFLFISVIGRRRDPSAEHNQV